MQLLPNVPPRKPNKITKVRECCHSLLPTAKLDFRRKFLNVALTFYIFLLNAFSSVMRSVWWVSDSKNRTSFSKFVLHHYVSQLFFTSEKNTPNYPECLTKRIIWNFLQNFNYTNLLWTLPYLVDCENFLWYLGYINRLVIHVNKNT